MAVRDCRVAFVFFAALPELRPAAARFDPPTFTAAVPRFGAFPLVAPFQLFAAFVEGTVFVRSKGAKDRIVPINATALRAVAHYLELRGKRLSKKSPVFVTHWADGGRHRRISKNALQRLFRTINKTSPKHVHPHLLRHSYAVHLIQNGVDIRYLQALMGHESPDTTSRYLGLVKQDLRRAYDAAVEVILAG